MSTARPKAGADRPSRHTSIIYFHGMGTPKRYEELSRVLDTLDRYVESDSDEKLGMLRGQVVGLEPSRSGDDEPVAFIRFIRFLRRPDGSTRMAGRYRLYESYWSPAAAGRVSSLAVLFWVFVRALHPFTVLLSPWRAHQRLKMTFLNRMFYDRGRIPADRFRELSVAYREFEGMGARRDHRSGLFGGFLAFLRAKYRHNSRALADLIGLSKAWRRTLVASQLGVLAIGATALAGLVGLTTITVYLGASILAAAGVADPTVTDLVRRASPAPLWSNDVFNFVLGGAAVWIAVQAGRFLKLFLADVVFWTTTFEKDARYRTRREILRAAEDTILHVLRDPACERIVILGHSLGTAIAYETLLNLGRRMSAERQSGAAGPSRYEGLRKISHFITLGSPIDRINYFFHLTFSRYHRFNRVADTLLGRASDLPFRDRRAKVIQWINVRDASDPIASRLFSPRGPLPNRDDVQEVEVSNGHFPDPVGAHTGYFDSKLASRLLFDTCILGRTSLQLHQNRPAWSKIVADILRPAVWRLGSGLTWLVAIGAVGYWLDMPDLMRVSQIGAAALTALVIVAALVGRLLDRFHSLRLA